MMDKLSAEDVVSSYASGASGERNFSWKNLSGLDLHGADLRDANLFGSNVSSTHLTDANLEGSNLGQANLRDALLRNANQRRVFLSGADLTGADATGADATGAELMETQLPLPPSAPLQAMSQMLPPAFSPQIHVPAEKSPGLAGFLEYLYPGVGLLYCDATKPGLWVLIGTTVANVIMGLLLIPIFVLDLVITGGRSADDVRLFPDIFLSIIVSLSLIWLVVRIVCATRAARAFNEQRLDMRRALKAQFRAGIGG
jgi:hypothetical protein